MPRPLEHGNDWDTEQDRVGVTGAKSDDHRFDDRSLQQISQLISKPSTKTADSGM